MPLSDNKTKIQAMLDGINALSEAGSGGAGLVGSSVDGVVGLYEKFTGSFLTTPVGEFTKGADIAWEVT